MSFQRPWTPHSARLYQNSVQQVPPSQGSASDGLKQDDVITYPSSGPPQAPAHLSTLPLPTFRHQNSHSPIERCLFDPEAPQNLSVLACTLRSIPLYKVTRVERQFDVPLFRVTVTLPPYDIQAEALAHSSTEGCQIAATALMLKFHLSDPISALPVSIRNFHVPQKSHEKAANTTGNPNNLQQPAAGPSTQNKKSPVSNSQNLDLQSRSHKPELHLVKRDASTLTTSIQPSEQSETMSKWKQSSISAFEDNVEGSQ